MDKKLPLIVCFTLLYFVNCSNTRSGTICKTYDDVTKAETCSGQTVFIENQVSSQKQAECATKSVVNETVNSKIQTSLRPLEEQISGIASIAKNLTLKLAKSESLKPCIANPCLNGGTCSEGSNYYRWDCNSSPDTRNYENAPLILTDLGCWRTLKGIPSLDGTTSTLQGNYKTRTDAIQSCAQAAYNAGYDIIGITDGGKCLSNINLTQYKDSSSMMMCPANGKGSSVVTQTYSLNTIYLAEINNLGCWKDTSTRAIPSLEKTTAYLIGGYKQRSNPFEKCLRAVADNGYEVFSIQNGGRCSSSANAHATYRMYGKSKSCSNNGTGSKFDNQVYEIRIIAKASLLNMGCWADNTSTIIPSLEGLSTSTLGVENYLQETETLTNTVVQMCARSAFARGYDFFALQNSNCMSSRNAGKVYKVLGKSSSCLSSGTGGELANQVYQINILYKKTFV